ncbi:hypothetical protein E2C01_073345 [Portunus trituberculatus]|uniref:Uncharacterized protein n=1 Tax=Portunus trituberculatus TaxID=210409 RepID=A0A5B7IBG0_PORTR|nr:hypothetical protein [Portunus trituberculatus]
MGVRDDGGDSGDGCGGDDGDGGDGCEGDSGDGSVGDDETYVGIKIVKTLAINLLTSIDPF